MMMMTITIIIAIINNNKSIINTVKTTGNMKTLPEQLIAQNHPNILTDIPLTQ